VIREVKTGIARRRLAKAFGPRARPLTTLPAHTLEAAM
jgi:hypothetical protein